MSETTHIAVMAKEAIEALHPKPGGTYIDGTLGGATHTIGLLKASSPNGRVLSLDIDPNALRRAQERLSHQGSRWLGVDANFRYMADVASANGFVPCDGILLDLGFSSDELADSSKGLSFQTDGPLDMRLGPNANEDGLTAADIVNSWSREDIERVIREYGEERYARKIAEGIVKARTTARLIGTFDLATVIRMSVPRSYERGRIHPATRTFQALRIAVNDELNALQDAIRGARQVLAPHGRLAIITFHSLEDRIVKHAFRDADDLTVLTKKPMVPTDEEIATNPRARSAKLRIAEKLSPTQSQTKPIPYVSNARTRYDETS